MKVFITNCTFVEMSAVRVTASSGMSEPSYSPSKERWCCVNTYVNPLSQTVEEAEELVQELRQAADELAVRISTERQLASRLKEFKDALQAAEAELINEAVVKAQVKEGPLANIASTSKAFGYAVDKLLADARQSVLAELHEEVCEYTYRHEDASILLQQAQVIFAARKHAADLKAAILNARIGVR